MVFSINRLVFLDSLQRCSKIIDPKLMSPSYGGIDIKIDDSKMLLVSSNEQISMKTEINVGSSDLDIREIGEVLVKPKYLLDILRKMDDDIVSLSFVEVNLLTVNGDKNEFSLSVFDHTTFPIIGFRENGKNVEIDCFELKKSISQTIIAVDEYNQKMYMSGLNFRTSIDTLTISGTDTKRISLKKIVLDKKNEKENDANIPYKTCVELIKTLPEKGKCKILFFDDHVSFMFENTVFQTTILEGKFPDFEKLFPDDFASQVFVDNKVFSKLISRADILNDDNEVTIINLSLNGEVLYVKSNIPHIGSFEEEFKEFKLRGIEEFTIKLNCKFLLESLKSFNTKTINIKVEGERRPIVLSSDENETLQHIIMPMK